MVKKFILNADGFGINTAYNNAILEGYKFGLLKGASITANGDAFEDGIKRVLSECPELSVGVHLNITNGKPLCSDLNELTDENGNFKNCLACSQE